MSACHSCSDRTEAARDRSERIASEAALAAVPHAPAVIVVTTFDDDAYVLDAIAAGARGFLLKRCSGRALVEAVRTVAEGESILSTEVTEAVLEACDSIITHRRRLASGDGPSWPVHSAIGLLLIDPTNPRSVAFQLDRLTEVSAPQMDDYPYGTAGIGQRHRSVTV